MMNARLGPTRSSIFNLGWKLQAATAEASAGTGWDRIDFVAFVVLGILCQGAYTAFRRTSVTKILI